MDVVSRLKYFMDSSGLTISQFADTCNIPRPTMSQLMSGRNKRISNEIFDKIHNGFPNLSIMWLMFGEGQMLLDQNIEFSEPQISVSNNEMGLETVDNMQVDDLQSSLFSSSDSDQSGKTDSIGAQNDGSGIEIGVDTNKVPPADAEMPRREVYFTDEAAFDTQTPVEQSTPQHRYNVNSISGQQAQQQPLSAPQVQQPYQPAQLPGQEAQNHETAHVEANRVSIAPDSRKKITNIVVFYSDNSFQSFLPDM